MAVGRGRGQMGHQVALEDRPGGRRVLGGWRDAGAGGTGLHATGPRAPSVPRRPGSLETRGELMGAAHFPKAGQQERGFQQGEEASQSQATAGSVLGS